MTFTHRKPRPFWRTLLIAGGCALLAVHTASVSAQGDPAATKRQIEAVKSQIDALNQSIRSDQNKKASEQKAIGEIDRDIAKTSNEVRKLQSQIASSHEHLKTLDQRQAQINKDLASQRASIAALVENSYRNGPQEPVKLVLNQQDPATLTRLMQYQRYSHDARQQKLNSFEQSLAELNQVKADAQQDAMTSRTSLLRSARATTRSMASRAALR